MTKKKSAVKKGKANKKAAPKAERKRKIARQAALPGMEDTKLRAIEDCALEYVEIRDERQKMTIDEVTLKTRLLELMHKHGKTEYKRNGISIQIIPEGEKIKVRVKAEGSPDDPIVLPEPQDTDAVGEIQEEEAS